MNNLLSAKIVYRTFSEPTANIVVPGKNQKYSIRGFFLPAIGKTYQFFTNLPLRQYWKIDEETNNLIPIFPPFVLSSRDFIRTYNDKNDVFMTNDLSIKPHVSAPCLNIATQDRSLYEFATTEEASK